MPMLGELTPRMIRSASSPSSTKSSGCGSIRTSMPSRSKIGTSSSIDRKNARSDSSAFSGRPGELGVDHVDAEVDGDLDDALPVAHRGFAGVLVGSRPTQHRQHRGDADARVRARLAELGHQVVVGARVVEERDEVAVRRQLQVLIAQIGHQRAGIRAARSRGGTVWDPARSSCHAPLIDARSTILTSTGSPLLSDSTPASHTAAAA